MGANGMYLTLNQAAKAANKSPSTIHKALKSGRLSYASKDDNGYKIDPAELFRVFPKANGKNTESERIRIKENGGERSGEYPANTQDFETELSKKDAEITALKTERDLYKVQNEKIEQQCENWENRFDKLLLTYQPAATQQPAEGDTAKSGATPSNTRRWAELALFAIVTGLAIGAVAFFAKYG